MSLISLFKRLMKEQKIDEYKRFFSYRSDLLWTKLCILIFDEKESEKNQERLLNIINKDKIIPK
jgi:hypothetical protein